MTAVFTHSSLASFMGSWPVIPSYISGTATFDPRVLEEHAVILGVKRETSAGFNVAGKDFYLYVDGFTVTERKTISFNTYSDPYTLDQVITEINTDVGATVAYNDNGFLRLESRASSGESSALWLATFNNPEVFHELGLFSGIIYRGGSLRQAKHVDPDRQVALPYQAAISDGESFTADVINRAIHTLAVNTDLAEGVIGRKRVAKQAEHVESSYTPTGTPAEEGLTISDQVFTGDTQTQAALDRLFVVLDQDGFEFTKKVTTVLTTDTITFTNADGRQIATDTGSNFVASDETDEVFVQSSSGSLPAALQGVPMKILEVQAANIAVIQPIDPVTGDVVLFTTGGVSADRVNYSSKKCRIDQVRTSQSGTRVEGVNEQVSPSAGSHVPTRIDLNNRIVVSGATFVSDGVQVGDEVVWSGYTLTVPYSNSGTYRVSQVIDEETIEVVSENWGPAFLNPDLAVPGTLIVRTDGEFYQNPFVRFLPEASGGAIPDSGDYVKVVYLSMTDFRSATDDPAALAGGGVNYSHEADDTVQKAILAIIGPSATSISEYLHDDARNSMENIDYRLDFEHYPSDTLDAGTGDAAREGRHKDIRPDSIDLWPGIAGRTLTMRSSNAEATAGNIKAEMLGESGQIYFQIGADGQVNVYQDGASNVSLINLDAGSAAGVGAGNSRVWIAGTNSTGPASSILMRADAAAADPLEYVIDVDGGDNRLNVSVTNDGTGSAVADVMTISNAGVVDFNVRANINIPGTSGTAMAVTYSGGTALRVDVEATRGEGHIWGVGDGWEGGGTVYLFGDSTTTAGRIGGETMMMSGDAVDNYGGWVGVIGGDGDPGGEVSVYGGDAVAGTDISGGNIELYAGDSKGAGYSQIIMRAATAGASGTTTRAHELYLTINGATGTVDLYKNLDTRGNSIFNSLGPTVLFGDSIDLNGNEIISGAGAVDIGANLDMNTNNIINADDIGGASLGVTGAITGASLDVTGKVEGDHSILVPRTTNPGAITGQMYVNTYTKKLWGYDSQSYQRYVANTHVDTTASNQTYTTAVQFAAYALPIDILHTATSIRVKFSGTIITDGSGNTFTFRFYKSGLSDGLNFDVPSTGAFYGEAIVTINAGHLSGTSGNYTMSGFVAWGDGTVRTVTSALSSNTDMGVVWNVGIQAGATGSSQLRLDQFIVDIN